MGRALIVDDMYVYDKDIFDFFIVVNIGISIEYYL